MTAGCVTVFKSTAGARRCARCNTLGYRSHPRSAVRLRCTPLYKECMEEADAKLQYGDRMGALRQYERALKDASLSVTAKRILLYNCCCINAAFGDLELAQSLNVQVPLRDAIGLGLDFEQVLQSPEPGMLKLKAPPQVVIALKRFAKTVGKITKERAEYNPVKGMQLTPAGVRTAMSQEDISNIVGTEMKGAGMDKSLVGILKRVALLLLALVGLGAVLYVGGLQLLFPDGL